MKSITVFIYMSVTINVLIVTIIKLIVITADFFPSFFITFCQVTCWSWVKSFSPRPPTNPQLDWGLDSDVCLASQDNDIGCFEVIPVPFWLHVWSIVLLESKSSPELQVQNPSAFLLNFPHASIQPDIMWHLINSSFLFHKIFLSVTHQALDLPGFCLRYNHWKSLDYTTRYPFTLRL